MLTIFLSKFLESVLINKVSPDTELDGFDCGVWSVSVEPGLVLCFVRRYQGVEYLKHKRNAQT